MKCEFCGSEMIKIVDEPMGVSYECPECGHNVDAYYTKGRYGGSLPN